MIARDILHALDKRFRDRTPRDPRKLAALAAVWLRAEPIGELVIAGAEHRSLSEWALLRDLCGRDGTGPRLTLVVERLVSDRWRAALGADVAGDAR